MKLQDLLHITTFWDGRYFIELKRVDRTLQCCCWGWEVRIWYSNTQTLFPLMNDAWTFQWTPPWNLNLSRSTATATSATCSARCIYFLNFKFHLQKNSLLGVFVLVYIFQNMFFFCFHSVSLSHTSMHWTSCSPSSLPWHESKKRANYWSSRRTLFILHLSRAEWTFIIIVESSNWLFF